MFSMVARPPIPEPTAMPIRCQSSSWSVSPASVTAWMPAATPYCTNKSICRISLGLMCSAGEKSRTSPAMREENWEASKRERERIPGVPESNACQAEVQEFPTGQKMPSPVTTTLRPEDNLLAFRLLSVNIFQRFSDAGYFFRIFVGNFAVKFVLQRHHQLHGVQRVGPPCHQQTSLPGSPFPPPLPNARRQSERLFPEYLLLKA